MKKTLTVNLGGIVFHIDEDAYLLLSQYFEDLRKHFSKLEERKEIYNDIEVRISELLQERLSETKQVITIEDIRDVIGIMGQPWQFEAEENGTAERMAEQEVKPGKRFFRNPDDKIIAGVCSGIGAYFHLDPVWFRLVFIITIFFGGFGILSYLILWIVMPEAKTTSDRLQMRGEKINISNIEKSIREEVGGFRDKIGDMADESVSAIRRAGAKSSSFFEMAGKGILAILLFFWKILIILTGIVLMVFGLGFLIALFAFTFGWTGEITADPDMIILSFPMMARLMLGCNLPVTYLQIIMIIVLGIPFFMLLYNGARMIFRFDRIKYLGLTMFNIWVVGFVFLAFYTISTVKLFRTEAEKKMEVILEKANADTLYLNLRAEDPDMKYLAYEKYGFVDNHRVALSDESELLIVPKVYFHKSKDSLFSVVQTLVARGKSVTESQQRLAEIRYPMATRGSTLLIGPYARLPKAECWRGQNVEIAIDVPEGRYVQIDKNFHQLKPDWYYLGTEGETTTLVMTENGLENTSDIK